MEKEKAMTVKQILIDWLKDHGCDGLCAKDCGCDIDDLFLCEDFGILNCVPAKYIKTKECKRDPETCPMICSDGCYLPAEIEVKK